MENCNQTLSLKYNRQEKIRGWDKRVISTANVLVVGAGTTGNEVIKNLCLLGIGNIGIIDFDIIEEVNLNRCVLFEPSQIGKSKAEVAVSQAKRLNPEINVIAYKADVIYDFGFLFFKQFDCVIITVDNIEARMWVNRYCLLVDTPLIDTGIEGLLGNIFVREKNDNHCLECRWDKEIYRRLSEKYSCLKIGLDNEFYTIPMVITTASIIGGLAVQECIRILHSKSNLLFNNVNNFHWYSAENTTIINWKIERNENCLGHLYVKNVNYKDTLEFSIDLPISLLKEKIKSQFHTDNVELIYDKEIVYSSYCRKCGEEDKNFLPTFLGKFKRYKCKFCGHDDVVPQKISPYLEGEYKLNDLQIPIGHFIISNFEINDTLKNVTIITTN